MTIALHRGHWGRAAALAALTLLLHYLAAGWLGAGGGAPPASVRHSAPAAVTVELLAPPAARQEGSAAPPAAPQEGSAAPPAAPQEGSAAPPAAPQDGSAAPPVAVEASAAVSDRQVQSAVADVAPQRSEGAPAPAPYRVNLPPSAELTLDVARTQGGVVAATGQATLDWEHEVGAYRLRHVIGLTQPATGNLADMASEGRVGAAGIVPRTMTEKRRERAHTATHFDERGNITFSGAQRAVPMDAGAQDKATLPMQLAGIARAGAAQLAPGLAILVGEDRDARVYRFVVQGKEQIETGIGTLATWRLARVLPPGAYNARLDIWLAPGHEWYPVQLRSTEANGTVTTQTVRKIVVKNAGY